MVVSSSKRAVNLIITGAGAPGIRGTIYAVRQNAERRPVRIVGLDTDPCAVGRYLTDAFQTVPAPEDPSYIDELRRICQAESIDIILPQTTREIERLSRVRDVLSAQGIRVMVSDAVAIEAANNKWNLLTQFKALGLSVPQCRLAKNEQDLIAACEELGYPELPIAIKPPVSNGMRGVRILREEAWDVRRFLIEKPGGLESTLEDLLKILRRGPGWPELLVTEYLPGPEYSVDAFMGSKLQVAVPRLRQAIRTGITFRSRTELRDDMVTTTLQAARHMGLQYAFGFQFKMDRAGAPQVLECNPRIQGTMVASMFSGANVIWFGIKELLGEPVEKLDESLQPSSFHRFWGGVGVVDGVAHEI